MTVASRPLVAFLSVLTIFAPISMDIYLPVLPELTGDLSTSTSSAQLTISACLLGLAVGQLVAGPVSDRYGRSRPLLLGLVAYVVVSRAVRGQPVGRGARRGALRAGRCRRCRPRDRCWPPAVTCSPVVSCSGSTAASPCSAGLAAVVGPVLGGQLAAFTDWRGIFAFLAAVGALILLACLLVFRETLPAERRVTGGMRQTGRDMRRLLSDRRFVGAALITGFVNASLFAYLAGATFVLQDGYGLSPQGYAYAFGLNSAGFMVFGFLAARTVGALVGAGHPAGRHGHGRRRVAGGGGDGGDGAAAARRSWRRCSSSSAGWPSRLRRRPRSRWPATRTWPAPPRPSWA